MNSKKQIGPALIAFFVLIYVVYRASTLSFTHDEALTYKIINGDEGLAATANHHLLNTWLMQLCSYFSDAEWCLRLPNIFGFVLFACFLLAHIKNYSGAIQLLFVVPLLFLNNYFIDFFSLARGYGLSMGLLMGSVYYFLRGTENKQKYRVYALLWAGAAVLANLNLINVLIAIAVLQLFQLSITSELSKKQKFRYALQGVVLSLSLVAFAAKRLLLLKEGGQLYYGNESIVDGFNSIVIWSLDFNKMPSFILHVFIYLIVLIWLSSAVVIIRQKSLNTALAGIWMLVTIIVLGLFAEHYLFAALYPQNRTALFFIPLFVLLAAAVLNYLQTQINARNLQIGFALILFAVVFLPLLLQFKVRFNTEGVNEWQYDASTKKVAFLVADDAKSIPATIACNWLFKPVLEYYAQSRGFKFEVVQIDQQNALTAKYVYDFYNEELHLSLGSAKVIRLNAEQTALFIK